MMQNLKGANDDRKNPYGLGNIQAILGSFHPVLAGVGVGKVGQISSIDFHDSKAIEHYGISKRFQSEGL